MDARVLIFALLFWWSGRRLNLGTMSASDDNENLGSSSVTGQIAVWDFAAKECAGACSKDAWRLALHVENELPRQHVTELLPWVADQTADFGKLACLDI